MTHLLNDPSKFTEEMAAGFVAASGRWVTAVPGGVVRSTEVPDGQVAVVVGGGSGHYPAFAGLVGRGLAHGAVIGNVFASPSARQVCSLAKAANRGAGVVFVYGNYAGDVLNFDEAQEVLRSDGICCETVVVTDDVGSAPRRERHKRRGIAGDLVVCKAASAAAEAGLPLSEVARVAELANSRTTSFGVAFTGCTLPGAKEPLFKIATGRMATGLGIHGEPGTGEVAIPTADGLAELLVSTLLAEVPEEVGAPRATRAAVLLNGLGAVKYEELFVLYRRIAQLLEEAGAQIIEPEVGEFCTSFDMAGLSLTVGWLDDELEGYWRAPADAAGYRKGLLKQVVQAGSAVTLSADDAAVLTATKRSRVCADVVVTALEAISGTIDRHATELGRVDAVSGDGDHGIGMQRGSTAALSAARSFARRGAGAGTTLDAAATAWADHAGGASGALWGRGLRSLAGRLGDMKAPSSPDVAAGVADALNAIVSYGKAEVGDKTLIDVLAPFSEELSARAADGASLADAWSSGAAIAERAAAATASLLPKVGRAKLHGEKSLGTVDAGALSLALIVKVVGDVLVRRQSEEIR